MLDPSDSEDILKVEDFLGGETEAFEFLFDKYRDKVYGIAYRFVRNKEDALEVAQEVFLSVYLGLAKFRTNSKFFTWLYRITVNRAIDFTRSRKARPIVGMEASAMDTRPAAISRPTWRVARSCRWITRCRFFARSSRWSPRRTLAASCTET